MSTQDIDRLPWQRRTSDAWTSQSFRGPVLVFLDGFVRSRSWAASWQVVERFADNGITAKVPRVGPYQPPEVEDFAQRPGVRLLIVRAVRRRDMRIFEVGLGFPLGNATEGMVVQANLNTAVLSLDAEQRRNPVAP